MNTHYRAMLRTTKLSLAGACVLTIVACSAAPPQAQSTPEPLNTTTAPMSPTQTLQTSNESARWNALAGWTVADRSPMANDSNGVTSWDNHVRITSVDGLELKYRDGLLLDWVGDFVGDRGIVSSSPTNTDGVNATSWWGTTTSGSTLAAVSTTLSKINDGLPHSLVDVPVGLLEITTHTDEIATPADTQVWLESSEAQAVLAAVASLDLYGQVGALPEVM